MSRPREAVIPACYLPRLHVPPNVRSQRTRDPWVTPCPTCGGTDFDLHELRQRNGAPRLGRYCIPCKDARRRARHRRRKKSNRPDCTFPGCARPNAPGGGRWCVGHAKQFQRVGIGAMKPLKPYRGRRGANE